ncbi:MAG: hypothetical protein ACXWVO_06015 [Caulobacteraceae bacterium]
MRLLLIALASVVAGCSRAPDLSATANPDPAAAAAEVQPEAQPTRFTKAEFADYVVGKSKADIRAEFGPPSFVSDADNSWYYAELPIYDPDAGIQVPAYVLFKVTEGHENEAGAVRYP